MSLADTGVGPREILDQLPASAGIAFDPEALLNDVDLADRPDLVAPTEDLLDPLGVDDLFPDETPSTRVVAIALYEATRQRAAREIAEQRIKLRVDDKADAEHLPGTADGNDPSAREQIAIESSFIRIVKRGGAAEDLAWKEIVHKANETGTPIVDFAGVEEVLVDSGLEVGKPTIDPSRYEDAA